MRDEKHIFPLVEEVQHNGADRIGVLLARSVSWILAVVAGESGDDISKGALFELGNKAVIDGWRVVCARRGQAR